MSQALCFTYFVLFNSFNRPMVMEITIRQTHDAYCVSQTVRCHTCTRTHTLRILTQSQGSIAPIRVGPLSSREGCRGEDRESKGLSSPRDHCGKSWHFNLCPFHNPSAKDYREYYLSAFGGREARSNNTISGSGLLFLGTMLIDSQCNLNVCAHVHVHVCLCVVCICV